MLSATEVAALERGEVLKRYVRAAAALNGYFDDSDLSRAAKLQRGVLQGWWGGAKGHPDTIAKVARVTGLDLDELTRFIHHDGPPPSLPGEGVGQDALRAGVRRAEAPRDPEGPDEPARSPKRPRHGSG